MTFDEFVERLHKAFPEDGIDWYLASVQIKEDSIKQATINFDLRNFKGKNNE